MTKSESIKELAAALSKAQAEMTDAEKDGFNPHFKAKFATLSSAIEAVRKPLAKNGLSVIQTFDSDGQGICLDTTLMHLSGEWISSSLRLLINKNDMQGLGSAASYARRYSLMAITGIAQEDDDAQSSVKKEDKHDVEKSKAFEKALDDHTKNVNDWANAQTKNKPSIMDLAKFTITFGPNRGKQLQDIDSESLAHSMEKARLWLSNNPQHKDVLSVVEFVDTAQRYLNYSATAASDDFNNPKKPLKNHAPEAQP